MITCGEGKYKVWLKTQKIGEDHLYILGGGERPHIGSMVVKEPGKDVRSIVLGDHKDHVVMIPIAEKGCEKYDVTVAVVGGIHIEDASEEEIDMIVENCKELMRCI
ncbi:MAG: hypothetical protein ACOC55_01565 [Candidatus Natronoplasma sp.]